jgi:monoamine oxidase
VTADPVRAPVPARRVVVVGAGFAGLAAARVLRRGGADVVVFEARDRVGGRVWSQELPNGAVIERGAEFILPGNTRIRELAAELGLALYEKGTTYGDREPRGGQPVSRTELLAAYEVVAAAAAAGGLRGSVAEALAALPIAEGARDAIRSRIEVSTAYPADDQDAAVLAESGTGTGGFATHSIAGGNQRLAIAIAAELGDAVHLRAPVERVAVRREGGVSVRAAGTEIDAEAVVIAVPASVIGRIAFEPGLPATTASTLRAVRYGHAAKLFLPLRTTAAPSATLSVPDRFWTFTQLAPDGTPLAVAGSFAGTAAALDRLGTGHGPDRWIQAVRRLRPDLDVDVRGAVLSTWSDDPWIEAAYSARSRSSPIDDAALAAPAGPIQLAGEHTAGDWHALMEGALRSGERAAGAVLRGAPGDA